MFSEYVMPGNQGYLRKKIAEIKAFFYVQFRAALKSQGFSLNRYPKTVFKVDWPANTC